MKVRLVNCSPRASRILHQWQQGQTKPDVSISRTNTDGCARAQIRNCTGQPSWSIGLDSSYLDGKARCWRCIGNRRCFHVCVLIIDGRLRSRWIRTMNVILGIGARRTVRFNRWTGRGDRRIRRMMWKGKWSGSEIVTLVGLGLMGLNIFEHDP